MSCLAGLLVGVGRCCCRWGARRCGGESGLACLAWGEAGCCAGPDGRTSGVAASGRHRYRRVSCIESDHEWLGNSIGRPAVCSGECYPQSFTDFLHCRRRERAEFIVVELRDVVDKNEPDERIGGSQGHDSRHVGVLGRRRGPASAPATPQCGQLFARSMSSSVVLRRSTTVTTPRHSPKTYCRATIASADGRSIDASRCSRPGIRSAKDPSNHFRHTVNRLRRKWF